MPPIRAAVFGNVGSSVSFAIGHSDAELAGEFDPYGVEALISLRKGEICVRTVAGGETGYPFLAATFAEVGWNCGSRTKVVEQSRRRWGRRQEVVEEKIGRWSQRH
jgi:hypothetical protein